MSTKLTAVDLAEVVKGKITIVDGVATIDNKAIQEEGFAKLDTDLATVKHSYNSVAIIENAIAQEFSDASHDYMAENKSYDQVTAKTSIGEEELHLASRRESDSRNPSTGEITTNKGALTVRRVIKNRGSELTNIKQLAKASGLNKL